MEWYCLGPFNLQSAPACCRLPFLTIVNCIPDIYQGQEYFQATIWKYKNSLISGAIS
jgi:hypothetical protein